VGVITSRDAAALRDVLSTLRRRNPSIAVVLYPVPVQGYRAAEEIASALGVAGRRRDCDVLLLVRGGGSIEDLWTFNEEVVARALRACALPVVTGIGHETDFTIADFAADRRAPTPTAAAELVSPERRRLLDAISALAKKAGACALRELDRRALHVDQVARRLVHPGARLVAQGEALARLRLRLEGAVARRLSDWRSRFASLVASLSHLDPVRVLERGYSIVQKPDGTVVNDSSALVSGESVALRFARGSAEARIETTDRPVKPAAG
jgi:exodeoxyribonuclease VII large subunit